MFDHLLPGFDIQMEHSPAQTGPSSEEEEESKSDRISPRWKELIWHFHSERWDTLKWCWFDVMVGSYCFVEKVSAFNPDSPGKAAQTQRGARRGADTGAELSGHGRIAPTQIKLTPLQPSLITTKLHFGLVGKQRTCCEESNSDAQKHGFRLVQVRKPVSMAGNPPNMRALTLPIVHS